MYKVKIWKKSRIYNITSYYYPCEWAMFAFLRSYNILNGIDIIKKLISLKLYQLPVCMYRGANQIAYKLFQKVWVKYLVVVFRSTYDLPLQHTALLREEAARPAAAEEEIGARYHR